MKASNKKLLSLLIVVAMVLAMTPVITLPASAATAPADVQSWIDSNAAGFEEDGTLPRTCPFCGDLPDNVTWTKVTGTLTGQTTATAAGVRTHVYLSGTVTGSINAGFISSAKGVTMCVYLNDAEATYSGPYQALSAASGIMNIFGNGKVTHNGTGGNMFYFSDKNAMINVYGGDYTASGSANMFFNRNASDGAHVTIYGGKFNVNPETADDNFVNKNTVNIPEGYKAIKNSDNTYTVQKVPVAAAEKMAAVDNWRAEVGAEFTTGEKDAFCPCCWEEVTWKPLDVSTAPTEGHYYLPTKIDSTALSGANYTNVPAGNTLCLYLNDKELTINGRLQVRGKVNLIGDGSLIRTSGGGAPVAPLEVAGAGNELNIYGGTYESASAAGVLTVFNKGTLNIYDGTFKNTRSNGYAVIEDSSATYEGTVNINQAIFTKMNGERSDKFGGLTTVTGNAVVSDDGNTTTWYPTQTDAVKAAVSSNGTKAIKMFTNGTLDLGDNEVYVDCNGKTVTVKNGTLYGFETTAGSDYYDVRGGSWVKGGNVDIARDVRFGGKRYVTLDNQGGTATSYRYDLDVTSIALRTSNAGLYYKTTLKAAQELADRIEAYGVVLSVHGMPYSDWETTPSLATCIDKAVIMDGNVATFTSGIVEGIMKEGKDNAERGDDLIFANAYLQFDLDADGDYLNERYIMAVDDNGAEIVSSMKSVMETINANWEDYAPETPESEINHQATVAAFYKTWDMSDFGWDLGTIADYVTNNLV